MRHNAKIITNNGAVSSAEWSIRRREKDSVETKAGSVAGVAGVDKSIGNYQNP